MIHPQGSKAIAICLKVVPPWPFPSNSYPILAKTDHLVKGVKKALKKKELVYLAIIKNPEKAISHHNLETIGCIASVERIKELEDGFVKVEFYIEQRSICRSIEWVDDIWMASGFGSISTSGDLEALEMAKKVKKCFVEYAQKVNCINTNLWNKKDVIDFVKIQENPDAVADMTAFHADLDPCLQKKLFLEWAPFVRLEILDAFFRS